MASLDILLIRVRSDTPTSFFFVDSKTAFSTFGPPLVDSDFPDFFALSLRPLRPARFVSPLMRTR